MAHGARLLASHSSSPRLDAELLLADTLRMVRSQLIARSDEPLSDTQAMRYAELLDRRVAGVPVAYLLGRREFWSLNLSVGPAVLVPRPETELLVERALLCAGPATQRQVLDLGTGSGAIAIALASERAHWALSAVDVSADALQVAQRNAVALGLERITWYRGDWFGPLDGAHYDIIVSNPPYVAADDPALALLQAEPLQALSPGPTGMEALGQIISAAPRHLKPRGVLLLEHGNTQSSGVAALLRAHGFEDVQTHADMSGEPRVTQGVLSTSH